MADLITIATFDNSLDAESVRGKLEAEGIQTFLKDENIVSIMWLYSTAVGGIKLQISSDDEIQAREILARPEERIPVDHVVIGSSEIVCPSCQSNNIKKENYSRAVTAMSILLLGFPIPYPSVRYRCFYCDHQWTEKIRLPAKKIKSLRIISLVAITAIALFIFFRFYFKSHAIIEPIPESAYLWNSALKAKEGNLISVIHEYQLGELKGYTLFQGGNVHQSASENQTDLYEIFTKQADDNVVSEIFARYQPNQDDTFANIVTYTHLDHMVHIALVKGLPALPLDVYSDDLTAGDLSFSRIYRKGPLKDSDYYGFYDVQVTYGQHFTLFYAHRNNLLFEIAIPGYLDDYIGKSIYTNHIFLTLQKVLRRPDLDVIDLQDAIESNPKNGGAE